MLNQVKMFKDLLRELQNCGIGPGLDQPGLYYSFDVPGHPSIGWIDIFKDGEVLAHLGLHPEEGYGIANANPDDLTHKVDEVYGEDLEGLLEALQRYLT